MTLELTSLRSGRRLNWGRVLGLLLVPLTVAGVLLWGLWNPQDRLDTITAAVVNNDEPVELDGQLVPLGRVLAAELIDGDTDQNFTWLLTDDADAEQGLDDGRYATVVTIPENFSAAATSLSGDPGDVEQARIDVAEGDRGRLIDTALSSIVTQTATRVLNQQLGEQFVGGVYVGFNELRGGISEAAGGAKQLADGSEQIGEGANELADGTEQLADGTAQLADGAGELASGAGQLAEGAGQLADGQSDLATGVGEYTGGATQLAKAYKPLGAGAAEAATQLKGIIGALGTLQADSAQPQQQLGEGLQEVDTGADTLDAQIGTLYDDCLAAVTETDFCDTMRDTLDPTAQTISGGAGTALEGAGGLRQASAALQNSLGGSGSGDPAAQLDELISGTSEFGTALDDFAKQGSKLSSGASELATGAKDLADGAGGIASGASGLAQGTGELSANIPALADGAGKLADGVEQSGEGASELAQGLGSAVSEIPSTTEAQRDRLAATAVQPVETNGAGDELFNASGVPLFTGIALWAGALAMFLLIRPLWGRTRYAARGVIPIALRSALPAAALGAVQGMLAGVVLPIALGYDAGQGLRFFALSVLAGVAFALLVQGLSALLGGVGRFIAFALLVIGFAVGIVSTAPAALVAVGDASPLGAAFAGFQSIASGAGAVGAAGLLVLWAVAGLILTVFAVRRARRP